MANSDMVDVNGVKTAIASNVAAQEYTGAALNGALYSGGVSLEWRLPRGMSVTTSASGATYNTTDPIVWTGTDWNGDAATASQILTAAGGGETLCAPEGLMTCTKINVPAQLGGGGQFEFGVRDLVLDARGDRGNFLIRGRQIRHGSKGDILVGYDGDDISIIATVPDSKYRDLLSGEISEHHDVTFIRVYGVAAPADGFKFVDPPLYSYTTSDPITVYF